MEGPVQCYRCGEIFDEVHLVRKHLIAKHLQARKSYYGKERAYQCNVCKVMFETEEKKKIHFCRSLGESERLGIYRCETCDITFPDKDRLLNHNTTIHLTEKKFACDQCDFKVSSQCPRTDLNKRFLPRPKSITALKLIPHRSKISKN